MTSTSFRPDIQGLRAIAVLAVIFFHFNADWLPGGFVGVDVFLVLSGFLITSILLKQKSQANYNWLDTIKTFYISRFKRIVPAYFVMLIAVALIAAILFLPQDFNTFKKGLERAAWFNSNYYFAGFGDYFAPKNHEQPLLHTWSLAVEIQFYLLAPFLILLLPIKVLRLVFLGLLIILSIIAEYRLRIIGLEQSTYYSLYARLPEFFAGGLAAIYLVAKPGSSNNVILSSVGLTLILLSVIFQPSFGPFPGISALLPVIGCVLLLRQPSEGWIGRLLCSKVMVWLGALSYSLYLWHWPVLAFLRYMTGEESLSFTFSIIFIGATFTLSIISYYLIEKVFHSKKIAFKQLLGWFILGLGFFVVPQSIAKINRAFTVDQLPIDYRRYADPKSICHGKIVGDCIRGDLTSSKEVLVLGDSHAAMLNHFFEHLGNSLGFKARIITASSCVVIPGFDVKRLAGWAQGKCTDQIDQAENLLQDTKIIILAALWTSHFNSKDFILAFEKFLESSSMGQKHIYLISQEPLLTTSPLRQLRFKKLGINSSYRLDPAFKQANETLSGYADKNRNVDFINLANLPLFDNAPIFQGELMYFDAHHMNEFITREYAHQAEQVFKTHVVSD